MKKLRKPRVKRLSKRYSFQPEQFVRALSRTRIDDYTRSVVADADTLLGVPLRAYGPQLPADVRSMLRREMRGRISRYRNLDVFTLADATDIDVAAEATVRKVPGVRYWRKGSIRRIYVNGAGNQAYVPLDGYTNVPSNRAGYVSREDAAKLKTVKRVYNREMRARVQAKMTPLERLVRTVAWSFPVEVGE